jgi:tetratricopeptide (TPR) repeat protein
MSGLKVSIWSGPPECEAERGIEADIGSSLPVAFAGLRSILVALETFAPDVIARGRAAHAPEWNVLFPDAPIASPDLFELADAPNQRRLSRESEQVFRVLNVAAGLIVDAVRSAARPLVLRNAGACDLVSLRGIMHAVQCSRLSDFQENLLLCDWQATAIHASRLFASTRAEQRDRARVRMQAVVERSATSTWIRSLPNEATLEAKYLSRVVHTTGSREHRLAAGLLAIRACFFSTNYEGAMLAAEVGVDLLDLASGRIDEAALLAAWDELDDARLDIPMLELDRSNLGDGDQVRALLLLHLGIIRVFTGQVQGGLDAFGQAMECRISPELVSDLRLYRALTMTKTVRNIEGARAEIAAGLAALEGRPRLVAATHEAWLHNLMALTHFQEGNLVEAQRAEERSLTSVDHAPGPSATHLKTNLISNFSVLYEAKGDIRTATQIWQWFAGLNAKLGSHAADKVYLNRLGALQREAGDTDAALESYRGALHKAQTTGDVFHAESIAGAIARVHLERGRPGDGEHAATWYRAAAKSARVCGDCLQLAKNLAGCAIATGGDFSGAREVLACDVTYERETPILSRALLTNDPSAVLRELPRGKSKLSRPFTLVNL